MDDERRPKQLALAHAGFREFISQFPLYLAMAIVIGLDTIGFAIALASLMFSGELASGIGMAVTAVLAGNIVVAFLVAWKSQLKINIAMTQDIGATILAVSLAGALVAVSNEAKLPTAFAIVAASTLLTAVVMFLTGYFKVGKLVRFFPLEVLAGFMAATGFLLVLGGIAMVCNVDANLWGVLKINSVLQIAQLVPAVLVATTIFFALTYSRWPYMLLTILFCSALLFHLCLYYLGLTHADAVGLGLLPRIQETQGVEFPFPSLLPMVDWQAVLNALPIVGTVALLSLFAAMMNVSAIELATETELDVDKEIKLTGLANVAVAATGAPPAYSAVVVTQLLYKSGLKQRSVGFLVALIQLIGLLYATTVVSQVPNMVAAALVLYYGADLIRDWLVATRKTFSLREWGVVVLIVAISIFYSFLVAILVGFLIATILFVYSYSKASVIRNVTTLARLPSTTDRAPQEILELSEFGKSVQVIQLQGYLFFGTSEQVVDSIRTAVNASSATPLQAVILDFVRVTDIDSASAYGFKRIEKLALARGFSVTFCGLNESAKETLTRTGLDFSNQGKLAICRDLDSALENAEVTLLDKRQVKHKAKSLAEQFAKTPQQTRELQKLFDLMTRRTYAPGELIIKSGSDAKDIYFLESGRAVVMRANGGSPPKRLRTMTAGAILGEVAFSLESTRTADVIAETETILLSMSSNQLAQLAKENSKMALLFNQLIARALAEKILVANRMTEHVG